VKRLWSLWSLLINIIMILKRLMRCISSKINSDIFKWGKLYDFMDEIQQKNDSLYKILK